jgi:dienelactone hydrolase
MRSFMCAVSAILLSCAAQAAPLLPDHEARCSAITEEQQRSNCRRVYAVSGLAMPDRPDESGNMRSGAMAIHKPRGNGPFPALILLHTCAGIDGDQMIYWTRQGLQRGYVVFILDSFTPRGLSTGTCTSGQKATSFPIYATRLRDAYDALAHLATLPFVDANRISAMGFSQGGRVAFLAAGEKIARTYSADGRHFHSLVSVYGRCFNTVNKQWFTQDDTSTPVLALLGGKDEDGDAAQCLPRFNEVKAAGRPIEWHVYPNAAHAWDEPQFVPARRVPEFGIPGGYARMEYDPRVTEDSTTRAFAFISR